MGDGFDEELMVGIADKGGGNFHYIRRAEDIPGIFAKELDGLLSVVIQNAMVTMKPVPGFQVKQVYGYRVDSAEGVRSIPLGDVFDGEVKSILVECKVYLHAAGVHPLLEVEWGYVDVTGETPKLTSLKTVIGGEFSTTLDLLMQPADSEVETEIAITESALVTEEALHAFYAGDEELGKKLLQQQADQLLVAAVRSKDPGLREESEKLYSQLENFSYSQEACKSLHEQKYRRMKRNN